MATKRRVSASKERLALADGLPARAHEAAELLAAGGAPTAIARFLEVDEKLIRKWGKDPEFLDAVEKRIAENYSHVHNTLRAALPALIARQLELALDPDPDVSQKGLDSMYKHFQPVFGAMASVPQGGPTTAVQVNISVGDLEAEAERRVRERLGGK